MLTTLFTKCRPDLLARQCENCQCIINDELGFCPKCNERYDNLKPIWKIFFSISINEVECTPCNNVAVGPMLDPVMGISRDDLFYLEGKLNEVDWTFWISKYFVNMRFMANKSGNKLQGINLLMGNQLTFINWVCLQPQFGVDKTAIDSILIEKLMYEEDMNEM
ncbi:hypothetical protein TRFO_24801 [Tritrichomonas foetus]|uniref:Uncharacterized protein n=1 Tax=Tritrichomonas foetus TaxID=1144522 RepID=A0A1J4K6C4_9EUKA|nr:hypothetical protein TRFO_24801 [Tritrichomonas foetus]|eukprot:OHT07001.1 hypothetical protein TRFO_24801 [Tritrichomonas foetus]